MGKDKWNGIRAGIMEKLRFLGEDPDSEEELHVEEKSISQVGDNSFREKLASNRRRGLISKVIVAVLIAGMAGGFALYNRLHMFTDYEIAESQENTAVSGSSYEVIGKNIYRYNSDGISCINRKDELQWSVTYSMQAPISDVCGSTMVVAEQQGTQVYVVNEDGLIGNFETLMPILKVRVSNQGVVAVVLEDDDITWINLYEPDGSAVASDKTTMTGSGYPLDIDISPNGEKLAVSYLSVSEGIIRSDVVFYHFGSAGQTKENNIVSSQSFTDSVIPEVYFIDNSKAAAVADKGFAVFQGSDAPVQTAYVEFDEEIIASFHDGDRIGFLFQSSSEEYTYRMELYTYRGRRKVSKDIDASFERIKLENGQILMYTENGCDVFTLSGHKRFTCTYEKEIADMFYLSEFRKYLIITGDSFDRIRIC